MKASVYTVANVDFVGKLLSGPFVGLIDVWYAEIKDLAVSHPSA